MKFVPSLIDFHWCWLPKKKKTKPKKDKMKPQKEKFKVITGGRADIIVDKGKRRKFFQRVLEPLLKISKKHKETIYAWELINEPEGATQGSEEGDAKDAVIKKNEMVDFIEEGIGIINSYGFKSTVGYRRSKTIEEWKCNHPNHRDSYLGVTLHQFHYYPLPKLEPPEYAPPRVPVPQKKLRDHQSIFLKPYDIFVGEFATKLESPLA